MMKKIIILGGQGDGVVVASFINDVTQISKDTINLLGFLNDSGEQEIYGYPVLGTLKDARKFLDEDDIYFISALLKVKYSYSRSKLIESLDIPLSKFTTIIHPTAAISKSASIGSDTVIAPHVTVMPNVIIKNHCSVRASASIGHDCKIDDFCYIGPNATLSGRAKMMTGAHLGPNSSVSDAKVLGTHSVVGIGSCILRDVNDFDIMIGCPARKIGESYK